MVDSDDTPEPSSPQEKSIKARYLTIQDTVIEAPAKVRCVGITVVPVKLEPFLLLRGKWLKDAGFPSGQEVRISIEQNYMMIEAL